MCDTLVVVYNQALADKCLPWLCDVANLLWEVARGHLAELLLTAILACGRVAAAVEWICASKELEGDDAEAPKVSVLANSGLLKLLGRYIRVCATIERCADC